MFAEHKTPFHSKSATVACFGEKAAFCTELTLIPTPALPYVEEMEDTQIDRIGLLNVNDSDSNVETASDFPLKSSISSPNLFDQDEDAEFNVCHSVLALASSPQSTVKNANGGGAAEVALDGAAPTYLSEESSGSSWIVFCGTRQTGNSTDGFEGCSMTVHACPDETRSSRRIGGAGAGWDS